MHALQDHYEVTNQCALEKTSQMMEWTDEKYTNDI